MYSIILPLGDHQALDIVLSTQNNPVPLLLQSGKLPQQNFDTEQLVVAEKVLIDVLVYVLLIQIFHDRLVYRKGKYHVLQLLLHIVPVSKFLARYLLVSFCGCVVLYYFPINFCYFPYMLANIPD